MALSFSLAKRRKIVLSSLLLAIGLAVSIVWPAHGLSGLAFTIATYIAVAWSLEFDFKKQEWLVLPLYPLLLSAYTYVGLHWYMPANSLLQTVAVIGYAIAMYGLILTINILNVATVRGLPLIRQAASLMSLAGIAGLFGAYYIILSMQPSIWQWVGGVVAATFVVVWPLIWSSTLGHSHAGPGGSQYNLRWTALISLLAGQLAAMLGFWPVNFMTSLILAGSVTMIVGLVHAQQNRQVNKVVQRQYLGLGVIMLVVFAILSQWT